MIHDLDSTLEKLIYERGKFSKNDVDISFELPTGDWSSRLNRPTVNCWAYDLRENVKLRTMEMNTTTNGKVATKRFPPRRFDVSYLTTAWARRIEDQHQLLWRALGAIAQVTSLDVDHAEGVLRDQPYNLPISIANMSEHPVNLTDLWSVLDNQMHLGFTFIVTLALDTEIGFVMPLVFEQRTRIGQSANPLDQTLTAFDAEFVKKADESARKET